MGLYVGDKAIGSVNVHTTVEGIDTSDATAIDTDIINGKSAYVDGKKIYGKLIADYITLSSIDNINCQTKMYPQYGQMMLAMDQSFGDATAADVAKGKTFTSNNGLLLTGTSTDANSIFTTWATIQDEKNLSIQADLTQYSCILITLANSNLSNIAFTQDYGGIISLYYTNDAGYLTTIVNGSGATADSTQSGMFDSYTGFWTLSNERPEYFLGDPGD